MFLMIHIPSYPLTSAWHPLDAPVLGPLATCSSTSVTLGGTTKCPGRSPQEAPHESSKLCAWMSWEWNIWAMENIISQSLLCNHTYIIINSIIMYIYMYIYYVIKIPHIYTHMYYIYMYLLYNWFVSSNNLFDPYIIEKSVGG